ncbi:kinase-like domain-containing protein [Schizophyllum commune]
MVVDPPSHKRRSQGLRRVNGASDLQPRLDVPPAGRRMAADGTYLSPLRQLTTNILETYHICNPQFRYEAAHNPRRVLTKPSKPSHNDGYDNEDYDYILYVNDWLGNDEGHKYLILDILGQGTFGQVVKCQNMKTHEIVAVKVVKNKPAYFNQSMMEVTILDLLNKQCDPNDEHHILRLRDSFIHRQHLCLVFELLSSNLYELIKQNQFQGLSTQLVKVFMAQLLDALTVLKDARLIHCDLKPENILLKSLQSPQIKVIDFGSACHERQTVYTYIQSRFYRSPEVLLGMPYTTAIDMWSLGCIAVELFLGLPLFPGTSEYNQLTRIIEMLGMPPLSMLNSGKQTHQFFDSVDTYNPATGQPEKKYTLKSIQQYSREHNTNEQPGKQYFKATNLPDIISGAPMPAAKPNRQNEMEKVELNNRAAFIDFCKGLLDLNPVTRWTPQQARGHPFITGEKYKGPYVPGGMPQPSPAPPSSSPDPKRPYGGLVPQPAKGTRAFQDAASYNQHLAQHQAYTAQAQAASANTFRNPYLTPNNTQPSTQPPAYTQDASYAPSAQPQQQQAQQQHAAAQTQAQTGAQQVQYSANSSAPLNHLVSAHQTSAQMIPSNSMPQYSGQPPQLQPNVPPNTYYPNQRSRANTINNQMDNIPPALARLQHMKQDVIAGGRNALTPVLNRDDAMREWEQRQQQGKASKFQPYPQLEHLQQQAEMAAASGLTTWANHNRYQHPHPPSKLMHSYHPQQYPMMEDDQSRRDAVMSNVRAAAAQGTGSNAIFGAGPGVITSPSQAYNGSTNISNTARYGNAFGPQQQTSPPQQPSQGANVFDSLDRRTDIGNMYVPMQPDQYQQPAQGGYTNAPAMTRGAGPSQASMSGSFYGTGVQPAGPPQQGQQQQPQRNPFGVPMDTSGSQSKDASRRGSGIDTWQMKTS